jgi:hypothetical protein
MLEVLISAALGTIVLAGAFDVYVSSTKSLMSQANNVQMQADTKAAMDYMVREVRLAYTGNTALTAAIGPNNDQIKFYRAEESGYATGGTTTTLADTTKIWTTNRFSSTAAGSYFLWIKAGPGNGQVSPAKILSNTGTTLTLASALSMAPTFQSLYFIVREKTFARLADGTLQYLITGGKYHLLAQNVTLLRFDQNSPCDATTVCISLTARSAVPDSNGLDRKTGRAPSTRSLTSIAHPRN